MNTKEWEKEWNNNRSTIIGYNDADGNFVYDMPAMEKRDIDFIRSLLSSQKQAIREKVKRINGDPFQDTEEKLDGYLECKAKVLQILESNE